MVVCCYGMVPIFEEIRLFSTKQLSDMKYSGSFIPHADGALTNNNLNFGASLPVYLRTECKAHPYVKDLTYCD